MECERRGLLLRSDGHDDGMTGIIAARASRADIDLRGQDVDELALALVAPLGAKHNGRCSPVSVVPDGRSIVLTAHRC